MVKISILRGVGARIQAPSGSTARTGVGWPDTWGMGRYDFCAIPWQMYCGRMMPSRAVAESPGDRSIFKSVVGLGNSVTWAWSAFSKHPSLVMASTSVSQSLLSQGQM